VNLPLFQICRGDSEGENFTKNDSEGEKSVSRNPTEMIPKVKNQSREIPPRWFRRWKINLVKSHRDDFEGEYPTDIITKVKNQSREIPPRWFRRWKINLVKSHRDDSEGEYPTDIITKVSKFHQHNSEWWRSVSLESHNQIGLLSQARVFS
jgi:predicted GIY-YIG superfamily endonuclease